MACRLLFVTVMASILALVTANSSSASVGEASKKSISRPMLYATGEGAVANAKEQPNRAKAYLEAKAYAKMQAIAAIVQEAKGTLVEYTSQGNNYMAETLIKQEIKGVLDSVAVVAVSKRSIDKDMIVAVTVCAPKPLQPKAIKTPEPKNVAPANLNVFTPTWVSNTNGKKDPANYAGKYTSVIIDAQGLGVNRSMSPKILRSDGSEVWGTVKSDYDFISDYGIVAYTKTRGEALASKRAGDNPLIINAIGVGSSPSNADVIISSTDAKLLEEANGQARFLEDFRVIIIVGAVSSSNSLASKD